MTNLEKVVLTCLVIAVPYWFIGWRFMWAFTDTEWERFRRHHMPMLAIVLLVFLLLVGVIIVGGGYSLILRIWR